MDKTQELIFDEIEEQKQYTVKVKKLLFERYGRQPMAYIKTFGCQQNLSDGEKIKGILFYDLGFGFAESPEQADIVIYNTCAIRENAEARVFGNVGALKPIKLKRKNMLIGLCGCMMQQPHIVNRIHESYPFVDFLFGTHALHTLPGLLYNRIYGEHRQFSTEQSDGIIVEGLEPCRDSTIKANLPIMYGCDNFCTYCIVPYVRGRERSREPNDIISEARTLVADGYRELTMLGQNVNSYGKGLSSTINFSQLLSRVNEIEGNFWIKFMTSHPKDCTRELIDTIASCNKVCSHIHLPVQSGSNKILQAMNRRYTVENYLALIDYAREKIPGITFSSDIIVGFPGETDDDFEKTLELVKKVRYSTLYTFIYSKRIGTKAAEMDDPVSQKEKSMRMRLLLNVEAKLRDEIQNAWVGRTVRVLVDAEGREGVGWLSGRTVSNDIVEFRGSKDNIGNFADVQIERALNWALFGKLK